MLALIGRLIAWLLYCPNGSSVPEAVIRYTRDCAQENAAKELDWNRRHKGMTLEEQLQELADVRAELRRLAEKADV